jgi:hypothetical protein
MMDMVLAKSLHKPCLSQEVGVMRTIAAAGGAFQNDVLQAYALERKLYTGVAGGAAGTIQWCWWMNPYMLSGNERQIGAIHADGSVHPSYYTFKAFVAYCTWTASIHAPMHHDASVWLVVPYAQAFAQPSLFRCSMQMVVRVLADEFDVLPQAIRDDELEQVVNQLGENVIQTPKIVLVPSLQRSHPQLVPALVRLANLGARVLVTGVLGRDTYDFPIKHTTLPAQVGEVPEPVSSIETIANADLPPIRFGVDALATVQRGHRRIIPTPFGVDNGELVWCGIPVELAENAYGVCTELYATVFDWSKPSYATQNVHVYRRTQGEWTLWILVNDSSTDCTLALNDQSLTIPAHRSGVAAHSTEWKVFGGVVLHQ